jgi:RNA polymerase sigma factor (sigma-70 family)
MDDDEWLAQRFEQNRPHLRAVAYRMLGSLAEADDAVQEAWLRLSRSGPSDVENLGGWLTTVVGRVCLDMLRTRKLRREEPFNANPPALSTDARRPRPVRRDSQHCRTLPGGGPPTRQPGQAQSPGERPGPGCHLRNQARGGRRVSRSVAQR